MKGGGLQRGIGVVIVALAAGAATMLGLALSLSGSAARQPPEEGVLLGVWQVFYDTQMPSLRVLLLAISIALLLAAGVAAVESRIATVYRRSADPGALPLAPKVVMAETAGVFHGPLTFTVLIPAHNEADRISATLASLRDQWQAPERIIVVADNCTDDTEDLAHRAGAEVFRTVGNAAKKAGALNQALQEVLPGQGENDTVMIMDADTVLDQGYLRAARVRMTDDRALLAVGGLFRGEDSHGLMGQFQRSEYVRYCRDIARRRGRVFVLTGTASVFRPRALRTVAGSRGTLIPGNPGDVYDTAALTEDNELTLALKSLGALMVSPAPCTVVTEVMPSWGALWNQRLRWQRGALENLGAYGMTWQTARYWAQQLGIGYGVVALATYFVLFGLMAAALETWVWFPFWIGLGGIFAVERVVSVWSGGWRARLLGASLLPELVYATFLNVVFIRGVLDIASGREAQWRHVVAPREVQGTSPARRAA